MCLKYYGLGRSHYFSSRGISLDVMLKMTGVKLEHISDIGKRMRGGAFYIYQRYIKANNK